MKLVVYLQNGNTLLFEEVESITETMKFVSFLYKGKTLGQTSKATFNIQTISGYSITQQ